MFLNEFVSFVLRRLRWEWEEKKRKGKNWLYCPLILFLFLPELLLARPVSYPSGTTLMLRNNRDRKLLHLHYSPTRHYSIGYRSEYWRNLDYQLHTLQINNLFQRWNALDSQANLYFKSGAGLARTVRRSLAPKEEATYFLGLASDWETQRWFLGYDNRYVDAGNIDHFFIQSVRLGVAPYIGDYGQLHTWFMLDVRHQPQQDKNIVITPLIRIFKSVHLVEFGIEETGTAVLNWIIRL